MNTGRHPRRSRVRTAGVLVALVSLVALAGVSAADIDESEAWYDDYVPGDFGRVRHVENGLEIQRMEAEPSADREDGGLNAPIMPGDLLSTAGDERAEIQLAGGSLIRIDRATEVTFLSMPDPYAEIADTTVLQLAQGTLRLAVEIDGDEEFRVDTPAASVYALADADLRIEVGRSGRTRVWSRGGTIEVVGDGASVLLRTGSETEVHPGMAPDDPWAFNTFASDGFDLWVAEREAMYRDVDTGPDTRVVYEALPDEVRPYYSELSRHGRWTLVADYGYVWSPTVRTVDWRPYNAGYWRHGPRGYFWVSHEPWGWAPYHYGRWNYLADYGWCWSPGRVFGGAWVSWSWGSVHVGWSPLDYWNRPVYVRQVHHHYYDPYAWTFVSYDHFGHRDYRHWAVPLSRVEPELSRHAVAVRAPRISPARLAGSAQARREALTQVRADVRRPLPAGKAVRTGRSFDRIESQLTSGGVRDASVRGANARRAGVAGPDRRSAVAPAARFPSRIRSARSGAIDGTSVSTTPARRGAPRAGRAADIERTTPRLREVERGGRVDQRVREIYRRVAAPRESRESVDRRRQETPRRAPAAESGERTGTETRRAPRTQERPTAARPTRTRGETPSTTRPTRSRGSGGTTDRPRPSRGSGEAKPKPRSGRDGDRSSAVIRVPTSSTRSTASTRRVSSPTRAGTTPRRPSVSTRPSATSRRTSAPTRPSATPRRTSAPTRPSATPRRSSAPQRPTAKPQRSSPPTRPKASPRRSSPQPRQSTRGSSARSGAAPRSKATSRGDGRR